MKNDITNTSKPILQPDEQAPVDKTSRSTIQDNATLMRRRSLLKGLGAVPLVMTLHSGAAMAAKSNDITSCRGPQPQGDTPKGCVTDHDNYLRVKLDPNGKVENVKHKLYDPSKNKEDFCLVNVDADGKILPIDEFDEELVVTGSCWTSF